MNGLRSPDGLRSRFGGKGASLARLQWLGLPVPAWFAIEPDVPDALLAKVVAAGLAEMGGADRPLAVRSSGIDEDSATASHAGLYESRLGVVGIDAAIAAVRACRASADAPRVLDYRRRLGLNARGPIAVIVQLLVDARAAGVAFSRDPLGRSASDVVVHAVHGLGELLVAGEVDATELLVARNGGAIGVTVAVQHELLEQCPDGSVRRVALDDVRTSAAPITNAEAATIAAIAAQVEDAWGAPHDLEWAIDRDGILQVVQARPITTRSDPAGSALPPPLPTSVRSGRPGSGRGPLGSPEHELGSVLEDSIDDWLASATSLVHAPRRAWAAASTQQVVPEGQPRGWNDVLACAAVAGQVDGELRARAQAALDALGAQLADVGGLDHASDATWCTAGELTGRALGAGTTQDLPALVLARRRAATRATDTD